MNLFCQGSADHSKCPDRQPRPDGPPDGHDLDPPDHGGHRVQVLAHRGEHGQSHHKQMIILLCPGLSDQVTITISITIDKTPAQLSLHCQGQNHHNRVLPFRHQYFQYFEKVPMPTNACPLFKAPTAYKYLLRHMVGRLSLNIFMYLC